MMRCVFMPIKKDPKKQFSKWLAKSGAIYWIVFLSALLFVMCYRPEVAIACVYMAIIVSIVMIIHVWAYTKNSIYEKSLLTVLDKAKMEMDLSGKLSSAINTDSNNNYQNDSANG